MRRVRAEFFDASQVTDSIFMNDFLATHIRLEDGSRVYMHLDQYLLP
jgi:hypothetical protein